MQKFDYVSYMEMLATQLKELQHVPDQNRHFFKTASLVSLDELLQGLNQAEFPALCIVDSPEGKFTDRDSSNLLDLQYYYFFVLVKADIDDAGSRNTAISRSSDIAKKILSKMFRDKQNEYRNIWAEPCYGLAHLNRDSISYRAVGPIADNCYGLWCSFTVLTNTEIKFDASDWVA